LSLSGEKDMSVVAQLSAEPFSGWLYKEKSDAAWLRWIHRWGRRFLTVDFDSRFVSFSHNETKKGERPIPFADLLGATLCRDKTCGCSHNEPTGKVTFCVETTSRKLHLATDSEHDAQRWVIMLNKASGQARPGVVRDRSDIYWVADTPPLEIAAAEVSHADIAYRGISWGLPHEDYDEDIALDQAIVASMESGMDQDIFGQEAIKNYHFVTSYPAKCTPAVDLDKICSSVAAKSLSKHSGAQGETMSHILSDPCLSHECVICLDELQASGDVEAIPCGHVFHHDCISACIQRHGRQCPICRHSF